jgi:hypothetical protein
MILLKGGICRFEKRGMAPEAIGQRRLQPRLKYTIEGR